MSYEHPYSRGSVDNLYLHVTLYQKQHFFLLRIIYVNYIRVICVRRTLSCFETDTKNFTYLQNIVKGTSNIMLSQKKKRKEKKKNFTNKRCIASKLVFVNGVNKQISILNKRDQ